VSVFDLRKPKFMGIPWLAFNRLRQIYRNNDTLASSSLAIFAYLLDMSKIGCGTIPYPLLELNTLRRFL
ncbi:MAG: hypothetical protein CSA45_00890, partial [Gammaproteobacteria bacterium]